MFYDYLAQRTEIVEHVTMTDHAFSTEYIYYYKSDAILTTVLRALPVFYILTTDIIFLWRFYTFYMYEVSSVTVEYRIFGFYTKILMNFRWNKKDFAICNGRWQKLR